MEGLLKGRTAVITGGASGIGRAIALRYAEHGANVVVADLQRDPRDDEGAPTDEAVAEHGVRGAFVETDVRDPAQLEAAVDAAGEFGGLDVMVNNAGIFRQQPLAETSEEDFDALMAVNVKGVWFGCKAAAAAMAGRGGVIVNLSSVAGIQGSAGFGPYCASKGAVRLMSYALAAELAPQGIRVVALHPGLVETDMTTDDVPIIGSDAGEGYLAQVPMDRWGTPDDIAGAALFLASDLASYMTGASLRVDGGMVRV